MRNQDLPPLGAINGIEELEAILDEVNTHWGQDRNKSAVLLGYVRQEAARLLRESAPEDHPRRARLRVAHRLAETWLAELA